jgi:hypothetical protein
MPRLRPAQVWLLRLGYLGWPPIVLGALFLRAWAAVGLAAGALALNGTIWQTLTAEQRRQVLGRSP